MRESGVSDSQLLDEAKTALKEKNAERAKHLFAEFGQRSVARAKAKVANDVA